jgi:uncharacterized protein with PIN domain
MADKKLICRECQSEFVYPVREQAMRRERGFVNDPIRCPECRKARRQQRTQYINKRY